MFTEDKSSDNIFFSIITPNYNSGEKILRAIESLKSNSISYEHIIIDDCSTDDSFSSIEKPRNDNSDLVLLSNPSNVGPGTSRNKGLDVAKGEYIIFLDADDYFLDNALDILHSIIKPEEKIDVLIFKYHMITNTNGSLNLLNDSGYISSIKDPIHDFLLDKIISSPWGKCIKADLAKSFRFPNLRVSQDAPYNLDIFMSAKNVLKLDSVLYIFDKTEANTITRKIFNKKEFLKFYKSWVFFEKKALQDIHIDKKLELIASRKIKFSAIYYMSRLVVSPDDEIDRFIIGSIRKSISKNIILARNELSIKIKLLCFMFYFFPSLTIRLARFFKVF